MTRIQPDSTTHISRPIVAIGFFIGIFLSFAVLSGDEAGRVNLLYLLLIFLFIPLISAVISVISLIHGKGLNFARLVTQIPVWSQSQKAYMHKLRQMNLDKSWFFLQSQAAALAYSAAGVLVFLVLLLVTDMNFVWRSTLLNAEQILPVLEVISAPWPFWPSAQPQLELLQMTQDSRLTDNYQDQSVFGDWWAFILATQLLYSFILRGVMLALAKLWVSRKTQNDIETQLSQKLSSVTPQKQQHPSLAPITHALPSSITLNNWAEIDNKLLSTIGAAELPIIKAGPSANENEQQLAEAFKDDQLLVVKSWEPPMGELFDFMALGRGYLIPVDIKQGRIDAPEKHHLEEWQRFINSLNQWQLYLPQEWMNHYES
ncbi:DUF2868 domain-containing protein [Pleionea sediminis]|uniref:DUF2868 domain-containing protein n=1 Tax=Pleionea sediminis TaxID=2569479 RepID=UPI001184F031|nr:DUF2868 domain-containing protein [Pleionea sediminis]